MSSLSTFTKVALLIGGVGIALVVVLSLQWHEQDAGSAVEEKAAGEESSAADSRDAPAPLREDEPASDPPQDESPAELVPWRDADLSSEEFVKVFNRIFYEEGGQEAMFQYIEERRRSRAGTKMEHHVANTIATFQSTGISSAYADPALFAGLVYGGDMAAGRRFQSQIKEFGDWKSRRQSGDLELPIDRMEKTPLRYPAEMWVNHFTDDATGVEIPEDLALEIAKMRNGLILQEALLYQETFYMLPSLAQAAKECGLLVLPGEEDAAYRTLHPEYAKLSDEMGMLGVRYKLDIQAMISAHGLQAQ